MSFLSNDELQKILDMKGPVLSMSFSTDPLEPDPRVNSTPFHKVVDQARALLGRRESKAIAQQLDELVAELADDTIFWKEQDKGFLALVTADAHLWYQLPELVPESVVLADHPCLVPLVSLRRPHHLFYILELDKENTKLWINAERGMREIQVPDLPQSIEEVAGREQNERNVQFHTQTASPGSGGRPAVFHGSSSWQDDKQRYLELFLHAVERALQEFLKHSKPVVFLSGTEELVVKFQKISSYPQLQTATLKKNDGSQFAGSFLWQQVQPHLATLTQQHWEKSREQFVEEPDMARRSTDVNDIVVQSYEGRVEKLLIAHGTQLWGVFDPDTLSVVRGERDADGVFELVNEAAYWTLRNNGEAVVLPQDMMPQGAEVAAHYRY